MGIPSEIGEAALLTGKCLMAGLERMDITEGHKNEIERQIYETLRQTGGRRIIVSRAASSATPGP